MEEKILIVEDQFIEADHLRMLLTKAGYSVTGIAHSVARARELVIAQKPDIVLLDIFVKGKETGIDLAKELAEENIGFVYLSASSNEEVLNAAKSTQPYGFLVKPFREKDLLIMLEIAQYRHTHSLEAISKRGNILKEKLSLLLNDGDQWETKLLNIGRRLQSYISFDYMTAGFNTITENSSLALSFLRIGFDEYQQIGVPELLNITGLKMKELVPMINTAPMYEMLSNTFNMKACTSLPLYFNNGSKYTLSFYSHHQSTYTTELTGLLAQLQETLSTVIESIFKQTKAVPGEEKFPRQSTYTSKGITGFEGIVGQSPLLLNVFDLVTKVAGSDTSVLILGESGTGKERIADSIHNLSLRRGKPFVKVNCAALPATLIESELFGHEKGSFTGATDRRIGKFEKANQGTIFLDEVGELPLDLQVKLLRVLQEKYIERLGSRDITKVDVRIVAATNRNLEKEVSEGRFRLDLYYRLNVFPIELPPLRERIVDIPLLADHFMHYYNRKAGTKISGFSNRVLKNMTTYHWPGNIRELENMVERSVLLAKGTIIEDFLLPVFPQNKVPADSESARIKTIHEHERDYIITVLKKCNGKIFGAGGAAELLNLPPTTLKSRMIKLGIKREDFF